MSRIVGLIVLVFAPVIGQAIDIEQIKASIDLSHSRSLLAHLRLITTLGEAHANRT